MTRVLIVGAGIGGLATSLVLSRQGFTVDLVERQQRVEALGSGITLIGPALRGLHELGVYDDCVAQGYGVTEFEIYETDGSALAERFSLPSPIGTDQPGLLGSMRPTLHRVLLEHAADEGTSVRTGRSPTRIEHCPDAEVVTFSTGERREYDLVVGADGLRSTVRDLVFGSLRPSYSGQACFRVVLPRPAEVTAEVQFRPAGDVVVGFTPTAADRMYMYVSIPADETYRPTRTELAAEVRARLAPFGGLVAQVRDSVRDPDLIHYVRLETLLAPDPWHRGRTVLLGDAAHCPTPHLAAGAAMCIEDALVLGAELAAAPTIDDGLRAYGTRRFDRCKYVVETSCLISYWQTHPDTPGIDHKGVTAGAFERLADSY